MAFEEDFNTADVNELPDLNSLPARGEKPERSDPPPPPDPGENPPPETPPQPAEGAPEGGEGATGPTGPTEPGSTEPGQDGKKPSGEGTEGPEPGKEKGSPNDTEGANKPPELTSEQRNGFLSEMTGGRVGTEKDLGAVLEHYEELVDWAEQVSKDPKLLFPEGRARAAFEFVMKSPGDNFAGSIQKFYHVQGLGDPSNLSPKEAQFEAYMLKEENADLSREEGKKYFDAEYEEKYGEDVTALKDTNPLQFRKHEVETNQARKQIADMQAQFDSETKANANGQQQQPGYSEEEYQAYAGQIDTAMDDFAGISVAFDKDAKPEDRINVVLDSPEDIKQFTDYLKDPGSWWDSLLEKHMDNQGNFNSEGFRDDMFIRIFPEKAMEIMFRQGVEQGKIAKEAEIGNAGAGETPPGGTPPGGEKTEIDAWAEANAQSRS